MNAQPFPYNADIVKEYLNSSEMGISDIKNSPVDTKVSFGGRLTQVILNYFFPYYTSQSGKKLISA